MSGYNGGTNGRYVSHPDKISRANANKTILSNQSEHASKLIRIQARAATASLCGKIEGGAFIVLA
jgi:hypothetical protein